MRKTFHEDLEERRGGSSIRGEGTERVGEKGGRSRDYCKTEGSMVVWVQK